MSIALQVRVTEVEKRLNERIDELEAKLQELVEERESIARGGGPAFTIPPRPKELDELDAVQQRGRTAPEARRRA